MDLYECLGRVEQRIADCTLHIAHYESLLPDKAQDGQDIWRAATLLSALRQAEQMHREHRAQLLAKIEEQEEVQEKPRTRAETPLMALARRSGNLAFSTSQSYGFSRSRSQ